ncbi:MAG TPA: SDR family NAD(P)-dependent oxidoreductase [Pyrinomonadaceae bacterium]|nr:SDR family NAD(P)-dependent oxidoreductase [Pyrinomonadaceae bacterium]
MAVDWTDRVVLITGASSGIGRALAVAWARRGARVALLARRAEALEEAAGAVEAAGGRAFAVVADVRKSEAVKAATELVEREWGRVDVLVANAGIGEITRAEGFPVEKAREVFETNVVGAMNAVAAVLPGMLARGDGQLVAISSLAAYRGLPGSGVYCASKAALSTFFESLRVELRGRNVAVTTIHPGFVRTPMTTGRDQPMPFLVEVERAAELMLRAVEARRRTYAFPWQLAWLARLSRHLPDALHDRILARSLLRE